MRFQNRLMALVLLSAAVLCAVVVILLVNGEEPSPDHGFGSPCLVYGVMATPQEDAWLFTVDLKRDVTRVLGAPWSGAGIRSLAVYPDAGRMYALVHGRSGARSPSLARVDMTRGEMTVVGGLGMERAQGLSVRPTDGTLWTWWSEHGLAQIDPESAAVKLVLQGDLPVSALAWHPDGGVLYLAGGNSLWVYEEGASSFPLVTGTLPVPVGGLTMRRDGRLLLTAASPDESAIELLVFDPAVNAVAATFRAPGLPVGRRKEGELGAARVQALTWPIACGNPSPGGEASLIQDVRLDRSRVCPGEAVHVQVNAVHPEGAGNAVRVWINGQPGEERNIRFGGRPGSRVVQVTASTAEGYVDSERVEVELAPCDPDDPIAILLAGVNRYRPYTADFLVANSRQIAPKGTVYEWDFGDGSSETGDSPFVSHSYERTLLPDEEYAVFEAAVRLKRPDGSRIGTSRTVSIWNFYHYMRKRGVLSLPSTYEPRLVSSGGHLSAEYTVRNIEETPIELTGRQIEFQSCDPAQDPAMQEVEPRSRTIGPGEEITDSVVLREAEIPEGACGVGLHLTGKKDGDWRVESHLYFKVKESPFYLRQVTDEDTLAMLEDVIRMTPGSDPDVVTDEDIRRLSSTGAVAIPRSMRTAEASPRVQTSGTMVETGEEERDCRTVLLSGGDYRDEPIDPLDCPCERGDRPPEGWCDGEAGECRIACQATGGFDRYPPHLANALKGEAILVSGCEPVGEMLRKLNQVYMHTGIMTRNYTEIAHSTTTDQRAEEEDFQDDELKWKEFAYYLGEAALFGAPLAIFWNELAEGSELEADIYRASLNEDALRYSWPGVIREDIGTAFSRVYLTDEDGHQFYFTDFKAEPQGCDYSMAPPLVVKPHPGKAHIVRNLLHEAADIAVLRSTPVYDGFKGTGYGHYRLYAYSNAAIALDRHFDHPAGEPATVCSTFVWSVLKEAGISFERELEVVDISNASNTGKEKSPAQLCEDCAQYFCRDCEEFCWSCENDEPWCVKPYSCGDCPGFCGELDYKSLCDGLYLYPRKLREEAVGFGWETTRAMVDAGNAYEWLYAEAADDIANQLTNCFVSDDCGAGAAEHKGWENPGDGCAVSPDNLLLWDEPEADANGVYQHGVYGYVEPAVYLSGGWKRRYRWRASSGTGAVAGKVIRKADDSEVAEATVVLGDRETVTDDEGAFRFTAVPAGTYEIEAHKMLPGEFLLTPPDDPRLVTVDPEHTSHIKLALESVPDWYRMVTFEDDLDGYGYWHQDAKWRFRWVYAEVEVKSKYDHFTGRGCWVDKYRLDEPGEFFWKKCYVDSCLELEGTCTYCDGTGICDIDEETHENGVLVELYPAMIDKGVGRGTLKYTTGTRRHRIYVPPDSSREFDVSFEEKDWTWYSWPSSELDRARMKLKLTNGSPHKPDEPDPVVPLPVEVGRTHVHFGSNSSELRTWHDPDLLRLARAADTWRRHPGSRIVIEGHTDSHRSDEYNMGLSKRRGAAVKRYLVDQEGVTEDRITIKGYGERKPVAPNWTRHQRARNRRTEIVVLSE